MSIQIYDPKDFMQLTPPSHLYLVDPIVPLGGIIFVYGKSGVGKSPFSWEVADAVAKGVPLLGLSVPTPVPVLYVDVDTRWWTIQQRWREAGYEPGFDVAVGDAFDCLSATWEWSETRQLFKLKQAERQYKLVVISTLAKVHSFSFGDPNAPATVYARWQEVFGEETAIMFIHHDKKSVKVDEGADDDSLYHIKRESFSGNQQWLDHCTVALHLVRRGSDYKFTVEQVKDQGSKKADPMKVELGEKGVGVKLEVEETKKENWLG